MTHERYYTEKSPLYYSLINAIIMMCTQSDKSSEKDQFHSAGKRVGGKRDETEEGKSSTLLEVSMAGSKGIVKMMEYEAREVEVEAVSGSGSAFIGY